MELPKCYLAINKLTEGNANIAPTGEYIMYSYNVKHEELPDLILKLIDYYHSTLV